jgi:primosomal protein N'
MEWWVLMVLIIVGTGILGGVGATALENPEAAQFWVKLRSNIVIGIIAAMSISLFLQVVSSTLLSDWAKSPKNEHPFIFAAYCVLAAVSARTFIQNLSNSVLKSQLDAAIKNSEDAKKKADEAKAETKQAHQTADEAKGTADEAKKKVEQIKKTSQETSRVLLNTALNSPKGESAIERSINEFPEIQPGNVIDDPWKGQFGGQAQANNRKLEVSVTAQSTYCTIKMRVTSTDPAQPLSGKVQFYLHPTFKNNPKPVVPVIDGIAKLDLAAYGAFTIGVLADAGQTKLEYDLVNSEAPDWFKEQ